MPLGQQVQLPVPSLWGNARKTRRYSEPIAPSTAGTQDHR